MANKITCLVVDDDEIDRMTAVSFIEDFSFMEILGAYKSPVKALEEAQAKKPDALFLDIDMQEMSGLELRKQLSTVPACVFITSYPDYALESFEVAALDFLVKPFSGERFARTMERLQQYIEVHQKAGLLSHTLGGDTVFIKDGHSQIKVQLHEIIYLEALKNYTRIVTAHKKYTVLTPLGTLIQENSFKKFVRIHRSYAVQPHYIKKVSASEVSVDNYVLPVGRSYKEVVKEIKNYQ